MAGLAYEFWHERPKDRELRDVRLHATVATLSAQPNPVVSHAVQRILELMHRDGVDMTGISIPGIAFRMAAFEGVDWSNALMDGVDFTCPKLDSRGQPYGGESKGSSTPCATLRDARFLGTALSSARFQRTDISRTIFFGARLSGVKAKEVDFSAARFVAKNESNLRQALTSIRFPPPFSFRFRVARDRMFSCNWDSKHEPCVNLERVVFSASSLPWIGFWGAKIDKADFTNASLHNATFGCDENNSKIPICTVIKNACFLGANLKAATFKDVTIENSNFSKAVLEDAQFLRVKFSKVVFDADSGPNITFDIESQESLKKARVEVGTISPCTRTWRENLLRWKPPRSRDQAQQPNRSINYP